MTRQRLEDERKSKESNQVALEEEFIKKKRQLNEVRDLMERMQRENERLR